MAGFKGILIQISVYSWVSVFLKGCPVSCMWMSSGLSTMNSGSYGHSGLVLVVHFGFSPGWGDIFNQTNSISLSLYLAWVMWILKTHSFWHMVALFLDARLVLFFFASPFLPSILSPWTPWVLYTEGQLPVLQIHSSRPCLGSSLSKSCAHSPAPSDCTALYLILI